MPARRSKGNLNDWYRVSVDSLRAGGKVLIALLLLGVAFLGFRAWEARLDRAAAQTAIEEVDQLLAEMRSQPASSPFASDLAAAEEANREARMLFQKGDHRRALASARGSQNLLRWVRDSLLRGQRADAGEAQFLSVSGSVQVRHGDAGEWEPAASGVALRSGDYVRTGTGGSAEIAFANGSRSIVRPDTMFKVYRAQSSIFGGSEQAINMSYGWVNLDTAEQESSVTTPDAEALVQRDSAASVAYDRSSRRGFFVNYQGGVEVASTSGERQSVNPLQQVVQVGTKLSSPSALPGQPELLQPADNFQVSLARSDRLELDWQPVAGAARYALQIASDKQFNDRVIDDTNRVRTGAALGLRAEGRFEWRVAAIDRNGVQGPWSVPARFRVAASLSGAGDDRPPTLDLHYIKPYGSIFMLGGVTEPGVQLEINGERVTVAADGSFTKTIQLLEEGWSFLTLRARDGRGNTAERRERVFVEAF